MLLNKMCKIGKNNVSGRFTLNGRLPFFFSPNYTPRSGIFWTFTVSANEKVFMKKGEFGIRPPVTGAGFCSNVE